MTRLKRTFLMTMFTAAIASCTTETTPAAITKNEPLAANEPAATSCCTSDQTDEAGATDEIAVDATVGCSPSNCRGVQTKFGEAASITRLREALIDLKAKMEDDEAFDFTPRSYDIHDIVGETDQESIAIIAREVTLIETEFSEKVSGEFTQLELPEQKAKQIQYLTGRINALQDLL